MNQPSKQAVLLSLLDRNSGLLHFYQVTSYTTNVLEWFSITKVIGQVPRNNLSFQRNLNFDSNTVKNGPKSQSKWTQILCTLEWDLNHCVVLIGNGTFQNMSQSKAAAAAAGGCCPKREKGETSAAIIFEHAWERANSINTVCSAHGILIDGNHYCAWSMPTYYQNFIKD